jgi:hypothetical protein
MILLNANSLAAIFLIGCAGFTQAPSGARQSYPAVIRDSVDRRSKAEREWRRMLDAFGIAQTPPDLYPVTYTPRSLLGVSGAIQLLDYKPAPGDQTLALRQAVKVFIDRWRDLLGLDPSSVSLSGVDETGDTKRLTFRQISYPHPISGNFGEMVVVITASGTLMQLDDRFIPEVDLPLKPTVDRELAAKKVVGKSFAYTDVAGREQRTQINAVTEVNAKRLVVFPVEKSDSLEVHLAWEVVAGKSLSWTVYVDAINGEELRVIQNFNT